MAKKSLSCQEPTRGHLQRGSSSFYQFTLLKSQEDFMLLWFPLQSSTKQKKTQGTFSFIKASRRTNECTQVHGADPGNLQTNRTDISQAFYGKLYYRNVFMTSLP